MRRLGDLVYAAKLESGDGVADFATAEDLDYVVDRLDGSTLDGHRVTVFKESGSARRGGAL